MFALPRSFDTVTKTFLRHKRIGPLLTLSRQPSRPTTPKHAAVFKGQPEQDTRAPEIIYHLNYVSVKIQQF